MVQSMSSLMQALSLDNIVDADAASRHSFCRSGRLRSSETQRVETIGCLYS